MKPTDLLDFTRYRIQLPIDTAHAGTPDQYEKSELLAGFDISPWFVASEADSSVLFRANIEGVTTSGSSYPRSEMREMAPAGDTTTAEWDATTGTHILELRQAVTHSPVVKPQLVAGQVHGGTGSSDKVQILYDNGKIKWRWLGVTQAEILDNAYALGTVFTTKFEIIADVFKLYHNGTLVATRTGVGGTTNYFKYGVYVQSNVAQGDAAGAYGEVKVYSAYTYHSFDDSGGVERVNKSVVNTGVAGTTTVIPMPVGVKTDDRLYALLYSVATSPTLTAPAGWTLLGEHTVGTVGKSAVFRRTAGATEPASYTFTWSASGRNFGSIVAYDGVDLTVPPLFTKVSAQDTDTPLTTGAVGLNDGDRLLTFVAGRQNPGTDTAKSWTNSDTADLELMDTYSTNTGTGAKLTAAVWDSNRALSGGPAQRTVDPNLSLSHYHAWGIRVPAAASTPPPTGPNPWTRMDLPLR